VQSIEKSILVLSLLYAFTSSGQDAFCQQSSTGAIEDKPKLEISPGATDDQKPPVKETSEETPATPTPPALDWKSIKPGDRPPPPDFAAAEKLYNARKFALAQKEFQKYIALGIDDVKTHFELAYCYYYQRVYSKAQKEFEWVAKNAKVVTMQRGAEATARSLKCCRMGICPGNCLKANDPRWQRLPDKDPSELWIKFPFSGGYSAWSQHHIGQVVEYVNGRPENKGTCPICDGTGKVAVLKDGAPPPQ
jgi:hypothetical protein